MLYMFYDKYSPEHLSCSQTWRKDMSIFLHARLFSQLIVDHPDNLTSIPRFSKSESLRLHWCKNYA